MAFCSEGIAKDEGDLKKNSGRRQKEEGCTAKHERSLKNKIKILDGNRKLRRYSTNSIAEAEMQRIVYITSEHLPHLEQLLGHCGDVGWVLRVGPPTISPYLHANVRTVPLLNRGADGRNRDKDFQGVEESDY